MKRRITCLGLLGGLCWFSVGSAQAEPPAAEETSGDEQELDPVPELRTATPATQRGELGLAPGAPQATAILGGVTPAFGEPSRSRSDWLFDIHGFLLLPLRVGINEREDAGAGQKDTVLHTPPVVPGEFDSFEYSGVHPDPWAQLNFSYGNQDVTATVIIAARTVSNANGYFDPADQLGINDAFLTFRPEIGEHIDFNVDVGAFANRYGIMGEYDLGRYGTPVIARLGGVGATATGTFPLGSTQLAVEAGIMGQLNKSPVGVEPAGWNGFADPNAGTSFAAHAHAAWSLLQKLQLGAHVIHTLSQDDRATTGNQKDGSIGVYGTDVRFTLERFGHLYAGYAYTNADTARPVSGVIRVLNARGGLGLMEEYFGLQSEGTGQLNTFGLQYDLSLGHLFRHPQPFTGEGPDLALSLFGLGTSVSTPVPELDGITKLKFGAAATYSFLRWMAAGVRYDYVAPDIGDTSRSHGIISPRLIFKSDWSSRDQVILQYSGYLYGSHSAPHVGYPPRPDPTVAPDPHVISLIGSIWF